MYGIMVMVEMYEECASLYVLYCAILLNLD